MILSLAGLTLSFAAGGLLTFLQRRAGRSIFLGQPAKYPTELIAALQHLFAGRSDVNAAYLAEIHQRSASRLGPHPIVGLDVNGDFMEVQRAAGLLARECLKNGEAIDFIPLGSDPVSQYMTTETQPFYRRGAR